MTTPPLSDDEIQYFREMKKREEHVRWLLASLRIWGGWIAAICTVTWAIVKWLQEIGVLRKIGA